MQLSFINVASANSPPAARDERVPFFITISALRINSRTNPSTCPRSSRVSVG